MKTCPKCSYTRASADSGVPDWQCPKCGIAYAKFDAQQTANWEAKRAAPPVVPAAPKSSSALKTAAWVVAAVVLGVLLAPYGSPKSGFLRTMLDGGGEHPTTPGPSGGPPPEALVMSQEALAGLSQLSSSKVVLFSTAWCSYCAKVKKLLEKQGVRYTEIDLERDPRGPAFQQQYMQVHGFPVTVIGSRVVGGYDERAILAALKTL